MDRYLKKQQLVALSLAGLLSFSLSGCGTEMGSDKSDMDIISSSNEMEDGESLSNGIMQEKDVEVETFKLVIKYMCESGSDWRITDTKRLYTEIRTLGLQSNLEVYIDNVHTDTSIVSGKNAIYDGILQDTMDDRIHNSLMLGFPISDTNFYYGCNVIEGQNSEFMEGYTYGYNSAHGTSIETKRRMESAFLEEGVYANQFDSVIDLIIVNKDTNETRAVSVFSNLLVEVNNRITFKEGDKFVTYEYDRNGEKTKIDECSGELTLKKK